MPVKRGRSTADDGSAPRTVNRALSVMRAAPDRPIDLTALGAISRVSPRTLQRHFRAFLGKTPQSVLQDVRFERARMVLLRASSTATVTDIALSCGFAHLGRFSIEYHKRYAEKPSETLRRRLMFLAEGSPKPTIAAARAHNHPTIAVIAIKGHDGEEALARSLADELTIALMRAGTAVDSRAETARYHLHCTLRRVGREIRLTSCLIDAATGRHLWAHRHDGTSADAFQFEENAAAIVAAAMRPALRAAEVEHARQKSDADQTAHELTMRALPYALALDVEGNKRSLELLNRAMECDPDHTLAIALAAWCHAQGVTYQFSESPDQARARALSLGRRAISIGGDSTALPILGNAFALAGDVQVADAITRRALAADGSSSWAWMRSGLIDVCKQRPGSAIERLLIALDLARDDPLAFNSLVGIGCAHFEAGHYAEASHWFEQAIAEHPSVSDSK
jgi:AraC-like DNA-binding protein/tetratricopeptide (TPR) repeat protein